MTEQRRRRREIESAESHRTWLALADIASRLAAARKQAAEDRLSAQAAHQHAIDLRSIAASLVRSARL